MSKFAILKSIFSLNYGLNTMKVRIYYIKNAHGKTLKSMNVFDDDFSDLWYVFESFYGKPKNVKRYNDGSFTCTARGKSYLIE